MTAAGVRGPGLLAADDHPAHPLWEAVAGSVSGACDSCAHAFDAADSVQAAGVTLLDEYHRHPSFRTLLADGYEVLTF